MQYQVQKDYNRTAAHANSTALDVYRLTLAWDTMQIKVNNFILLQTDSAFAKVLYKPYVRLGTISGENKGLFHLSTRPVYRFTSSTTTDAVSVSEIIRGHSVLSDYSTCIEGFYQGCTIIKRNKPAHYFVAIFFVSASY